jgi:hypothetical protein
MSIALPAAATSTEASGVSSMQQISFVLPVCRTWIVPSSLSKATPSA